jgi:hypothetical protein
VDYEGDCGTIAQKKLLVKFEELFDEADENHDGVVTVNELAHMIDKYKTIYPQLAIYAAHARVCGSLLVILFIFSCIRNSLKKETQIMTINSIKTSFASSWQRSIRRFFLFLYVVMNECDFKHFSYYVESGQCTAQVASQQGKYLARQFNKRGKSLEPFHYHHLGSLAYVGAHESGALFC